MEEKKKSCYNCAYCEFAYMQSISNFQCNKNTECFYPDGLPDCRICENYLPQTGISIKEKLGDALPGYVLLMKSWGASEEVINHYIHQDSAILGDTREIKGDMKNE